MFPATPKEPPPTMTLRNGKAVGSSSAPSKSKQQHRPPPPPRHESIPGASGIQKQRDDVSDFYESLDDDTLDAERISGVSSRKGRDLSKELGALHLDERAREDVLTDHYDVNRPQNSGKYGKTKRRFNNDSANNARERRHTAPFEKKNPSVARMRCEAILEKLDWKTRFERTSRNTFDSLTKEAHAAILDYLGAGGSPEAVDGMATDLSTALN